MYIVHVFIHRKVQLKGVKKDVASYVQLCNVARLYMNMYYTHFVDFRRYMILSKKEIQLRSEKSNSMETKS